MKKIIIIGASTGGPRSIEKILCKLPKYIGIPIIIIQHMSGVFTTSFSRRLSNLCDVLITEAQEGEIIFPNHAYIVPGDYHFFFEMPGPKVHLLHESLGSSPSIDMGMISAVDHYGPGVIGVILSGMGKDGLIGAKAIKQFGGKVIVESKESATIFGMPKEVAEAGLADAILSVDKIAEKIMEFAL